MTNEREALIEAMARAIAEAKGIEICSDASYRYSTFGPLAEAALTAISQAGYAVVPVEPNEAMIRAGIIERHDQPTPEAWSLATANIYRAMLSTTPITLKGPDE